MRGGGEGIVLVVWLPSKALCVSSDHDSKLKRSEAFVAVTPQGTALLVRQFVQCPQPLSVASTQSGLHHTAQHNATFFCVQSTAHMHLPTSYVHARVQLIPTRAQAMMDRQPTLGFTS